MVHAYSVDVSVVWVRHRMLVSDWRRVVHSESIDGCQKRQHCTVDVLSITESRQIRNDCVVRQRLLTVRKFHLSHTLDNKVSICQVSLLNQIKANTKIRSVSQNVDQRAGQPNLPHETNN